MNPKPRFHVPTGAGCKGTINRQKEHANTLVEYLIQKYPAHAAIVQEFIKETDPNYSPQAWEKFRNTAELEQAFQQYLNGGQNPPPTKTTQEPTQFHPGEFQYPGNPDLFNEGKFLAGRISDLTGIVQNDMVISSAELEEWNQTAITNIKELLVWVDKVNAYVKATPVKK